jgi:hypothetical protein
MRAQILVATLVLLGVARIPAQLNGAPPGLRRSVLASLGLDSVPSEGSRWAEDSAGIYRAYVECKPYQQGKACALTGEKPAIAVHIKLSGPDTAVVWSVRYSMMHFRCGGGRDPLDPPVILALGSSTTWVLRAGIWVDTHTGFTVTC